MSSMDSICRDLNPKQGAVNTSPAWPKAGIRRNEVFLEEAAFSVPDLMMFTLLPVIMFALFPVAFPV